MGFGQLTKIYLFFWFKVLFRSQFTIHRMLLILLHFVADVFGQVTSFLLHLQLVLNLLLIQFLCPRALNPYAYFECSHFPPICVQKNETEQQPSRKSVRGNQSGTSNSPTVQSSHSSQSVSQSVTSHQTVLHSFCETFSPTPWPQVRVVVVLFHSRPRLCPVEVHLLYTLLLGKLSMICFNKSTTLCWKKRLRW